jgi:hypothetical protein
MPLTGPAQVSAALGALALVLVTGAVARAAPLPSSPTPLAGSSFQGGDGDQDELAPYVDWDRFQDGGRVAHSPDPNDVDTAFAGGTKETEPGAWDLTTAAGGVTPGKSNIRDAWAAVDQPGADTFLYLAFRRESAEGETFVALELNHDARLWNNGHARIPCRRTGDLLVVLAASGSSVEVVLEQWTTTATDADTGCATRGTLEDVASIAPGDAQGDVNAAAIPNHLPGAHAPGTTIGPALFAEAALNLSSLLDAAFSDHCVAFGSIWMHSRSSLSDTAQMKD